MTRRRAVVILGALFALLVLSGCLSPVNDEQLAENGTYQWDNDANATYYLYPGNYTAVIDVQNRTSVELFTRDAIGSDQALSISALEFRYENGTVVDNEAFDVQTSQSRVTITPPAPNGSVGFTAPRSGPRFHTRTLVDGSHEVFLPPGREVALPLISRVVPGEYTTDRVGDRVVVRWDSVDRDTIAVEFYQDRDVVLFGGLASIVLVIGLVGLAYYRRQISALEAQREDLGLDVDVEDDDPRDRGPPPGMK